MSFKWITHFTTLIYLNQMPFFFAKTLVMLRTHLKLTYAKYQKLSYQKPSYPFIGATHPHNYNPPKGYNLDHNRICLGQGEAVFTKAIANLEKWKMYQTSWTFIQDKTLKEGMVNALLARHIGFYSIQVSR